MTPSLNIICVRAMLAAGQPNTIAAKENDFKNVTVTKPACQSWRSVWRLTSLFEAFGAILVVSYLLGVVALSGALLFYTFNH
ncbi:MAG: hypothetical protein JOZ08_02300 [Verrucomicrobia bacterium]|nr:hypothetical protein [Verrucomicrobiota bacterium]MBV8280348.1 hypothetical protein [Verrucomicrobiota bacterium]